MPSTSQSSARLRSKSSPATPVDPLEKLVGFAQAKVPVQLAALAEHGANALYDRPPLPLGREADDGDAPGRWIEDARKHLYRRRLPRAIRTDESHQLARLDRKAHVAHRVHFTPVGPEQALYRTGQPLFLPGHAERLANPLQFNMRHDLRPCTFIAAEAGGKDSQRQDEHGDTHNGRPQSHVEWQRRVRTLAEEVAGGVEPDEAEGQNKGQ